MLRFVRDQRLADGTISRREWLRLGGLAGLGLLSSRASGKSPASSKAVGFGKAKSVILLFTSGGQSQLESWDPKPDAPLEVRGEFGSIPTATPGVRVCELLPLLAKEAHRYTILRSVNHEDRDHGTACYLALTGNYHAVKTGNPLVNLAEDAPTYGAVLHRVRPDRRLPFSAVHVNGPLLVPEAVGPGQYAARLGSGCEPLHIGDPTESAGGVLTTTDPVGLPPVRVEARRSLLQSLDRYGESLRNDRALMEMSGAYRLAFDFLSSSRGRTAFDLEQEPRTVRDRYGRHRSGQACLLARRLVEAGVPWITVLWNHNIRGQDKDFTRPDTFGWDTHNDIFISMKRHLLPRFDQSFSALLADLDQRGLLDQTLVMCMGEFGRHPRVAPEPNFAGQGAPGRKHWPACYSIVVAGAGVRRGVTLGSSDRQAAYPTSHPVGPWDVAATMFHALGIDPKSHYLDLSQRPFPVSGGDPILGLFG